MKKDYLEYKGFHGTVHFSSADAVFFGKISGINDLVTFEGASVKELQKAFEEAVNDYISICEREKIPVFKSMKGSFNVRISPDLHQKAALVSSKQGVSLNQFVQKAIENSLENIPKATRKRVG
ncbi:MAG: type II toxin-antitoxin system HicB family antitoxin [Bacteroidota bacterium]|nr:type II toxin-antitoxin system HicB family antitoxin [Bacteroidota bacterium]